MPLADMYTVHVMFSDDGSSDVTLTRFKPKRGPWHTVHLAGFSGSRPSEREAVWEAWLALGHLLRDKHGVDV